MYVNAENVSRYMCMHSEVSMNRQTYRQTNRKTVGQTDRQTDRKTGGQTDRQEVSWTDQQTGMQTLCLQREAVLFTSVKDDNCIELN